MKNRIHVHLWDGTKDCPDEPIEDLDVEYVDSYPNTFEPSSNKNDGYIQFGGHDSNRNWYEIRIPFDLIPELIQEEVLSRYLNGQIEDR